MSLELKNIEKKIGLDTHIYPTSLKIRKKYNKCFIRFNISWQNYINANYGRFRQTIHQVKYGLMKKMLQE